MNPLLSFLKGLLRKPFRQTQAYVRFVFGRESVFDGHVSLDGSEVDLNSKELNGAAILVLDSGLPTPDRDAGSRTVFEHVVCLKDAGFRVFFWPADGIDDPRYSFPLRRLGVDVVAGYFRPSLHKWLTKQSTGFRCVLLNRPEVAEMHLGTLRAEGLPILYYGHDLHFARLGMEAVASGRQEQFKKASAAECLERFVWRRVNVSTYPSIEEVDRVSALETQVLVRPLLAFCFDKFAERIGAPVGCQIMFVGSFRHSPNVAAAQLLAREIFPLVRKEVPHARLVVAGAYVTDEIKELAGNGVEIAGWLSDSDLSELYAASRVAAVPLSVGAGIKLKVVEALSKGIPLVTTPVGAQGLSGLAEILPVRDSERAISEAIVEMLLLDDQAWLRQSKAQLSYARDNFSRHAMKRSLEAAIELAVSTRPVE